MEKARVKATGQVVTLDPRCNVTEIVKGGHPRMWTLAELELEDEPNYWTNLEHQYAGMAMQGILSNIDLLMSLANKKDPDYPAKYTVAEFAKDCAIALVEKMKEEK